MPRKERKKRPAVRREGIRLTRGGLIYLIGVGLIGVTAIDANINLLLLMFGFSAGTYIVNAAYGARALRYLHVERIVPETIVAGQRFQIRYVVTNQHRWAMARSVVVEDLFPKPLRDRSPRAFIRGLRPGESTTLTVPYILDRRGRIELTTLRVLTRFPFNLVIRAIRISVSHELVVFPRLGQLLIPPSTVTRSSDASGSNIALARLRGDEEYYGIREYRYGDNPRKIHWRRSARTGQLVIRETTQTGNKRLWCALDTRTSAGSAEEQAALEQVISAAATFLCAALEDGASVGLICNGDPLVILPPGNGRAHRPRLLRELAVRTGQHDDSLADEVRRHPWPAHWHGPCVAFSVKDDDRTRDAANSLSLALGSVRLFVPGTPAFSSLIALRSDARDHGAELPAGDTRDAA